jgi:hypothetical protein
MRLSILASLYTFFTSLPRLKIKQIDRIISVKYKIQGLNHKSFNAFKKALSGIKNNQKE